jgi:hypothetical protein
MTLDQLREVATQAATAFAPDTPGSNRARAYSKWYLSTYAISATGPDDLPDQDLALANYRHEIGG